MSYHEYYQPDSYYIDDRDECAEYAEIQESKLEEDTYNAIKESKENPSSLAILELPYNLKAINLASLNAHLEYRKKHLQEEIAHLQRIYGVKK